MRFPLGICGVMNISSVVSDHFSQLIMAVLVFLKRVSISLHILWFVCVFSVLTLLDVSKT